MSKLRTTERRIAIIHSELRGGGGSEARALWLAETLRGDSQISLISMGPIDLDRLNRIYGTKLIRQNVETVSLPIPWILRRRFDALRSYRLARFAKKKAGDFDILVSAYNVMDFGRRGIQYIADFSFSDELRRRFNPSVRGYERVAYKKTLLRRIYLGLSRRLAGMTDDGWRRNVTIANSRWTQSVLKKEYGINCSVIYPPVNDFQSQPDWRHREDGFVVMCRFSPEKRIEETIAIVGALRRKGFDVHLHILGRRDNAAYARSLEALCSDKRDWVFFEGLVVGEPKAQFLTGHKYGLSACLNESFGIGVAEMVKAGIVPWVPDGGGQVEIVSDPRLIYKNAEDAVEKIAATFADKSIQRRLRQHLHRQAKLFSQDRFMAESRRLLNRFWDESRGVKPSRRPPGVL